MCFNVVSAGISEMIVVHGRARKKTTLPESVFAIR